MDNRLLFLSNTDTATGLLSQSAHRLDSAKLRAPAKHYITILSSYRELNQSTRTPPRFRNLIRRKENTTFIYPNGRSYRVNHCKRHGLLLERLHWLYSTSANQSGKPIDIDYCNGVSDITIYPLMAQTKSSTILKLNHKTLKRIR